ncbi:unnamed protein product [Symbiodinium sp. CCMP2456]|nr:unnamed protein product [Symbiodinium sp. CCMP2456]
MYVVRFPASRKVQSPTKVSFDSRLPDALSTRAAMTKVSFDIRLPGAPSTRATTTKVMCAVQLPASWKVHCLTKVMFAFRLAASQKVRGKTKAMPTVPAGMETTEVRLDSLLRPGGQTMAWAMQADALLAAAPGYPKVLSSECCPSRRCHRTPRRQSFSLVMVNTAFNENRRSVIRSDPPN